MKCRVQALLGQIKALMFVLNYCLNDFLHEIMALALVDTSHVD
ncbi:hypothetical protein SAMN05421840_108134 [Shewanella morhuae]|nr:hypothetical protein SAMN05421840_108134 [Shewanella morhuae]